MTADVTREPTGGQELREALERLAAHKIAYVNAPQRWGPSRVVDAVLALPELAALIADAERVKRVRAIVQSGEERQAETAAEGDPVTVMVQVSALRRALDGEPQP